MKAKKTKPGLEKEWDVPVHLHISGSVSVRARTKRQALKMVQRLFLDELGQSCIEMPSAEVDIANGGDLEEIQEA